MRNKIVYLLLAGLLPLWLNACYEKITDVPAADKLPQTGVFLQPDSTVSRQPSRLSMSWWGDDPDGTVLGYFFTWDGTRWAFTTRNDSTFALQIGVSDTIYTFKVAAVDNAGNGVYDASVVRNGINFGPEGYVDANANGKYDAGEVFYDAGNVDPTPASINVPIRNSAPSVSWNLLTVLPDTSYPVMSFGWDASDPDGNQTIAKINICLNDTNIAANKVSLNGTAKVITLRVRDFNAAAPLADILLDGLESSVFPQKLPGMRMNANNVFYVQAEDISGAKSPFIAVPGTSKKWYVKKPAGKFLIIDDYAVVDDAPSFYTNALNTINGGVLNGKFDTWDILKNKSPYPSITFLQTLKLFKYIIWYSNDNPSLDLATAASNRFREAGGKILFSCVFPQQLEVGNITGFLPVDSITLPRNFLFPNTNIAADTTNGAYPALRTSASASIARARGFYPSPASAYRVYYLPAGELQGSVGFSSSDKSLFFLGLPLHRCNGISQSAENLLKKVLFDDFGVTP